MAHGGYRKHRVAGKPMGNGGSGNKGLSVKRLVDKTKLKKKTRMGSIKNQIRSIERLLQKGLPAEAQDAQKKRLEDLKKQAEEHQRAELERKMSLRYRRIKFFERRKIDRRMKRLEKKLESTDATDLVPTERKSDIAEQLAQLKEDLEYVRFFPKTEKYVSLFMGNEDEEVITKRKKLREQIKSNLAAAAASGVEPEEMDSDEGQATAVSDDEFFLAGSDDGETEDQFTPSSSKLGVVKDQVLKNTAKLFSANRPSGHKKWQPYKSPQNSGIRSEINKQRPGPTFKMKGFWQDDKRHYSTCADNKKKGSRSNDQMQHHSIGEDNRIKENVVGQKLKKAKTTLPVSSNLQSSYSKSLQAGLSPTSSSAMKTARYVTSPKNNVHSFDSPSHIRADAIKPPTLPEFGSLNMDVQKKRRRKHRPKKKKA